MLMILSKKKTKYFTMKIHENLNAFRLLAEVKTHRFLFIIFVVKCHWKIFIQFIRNQFIRSSTELLKLQVSRVFFGSLSKTFRRMNNNSNIFIWHVIREIRSASRTAGYQLCLQGISLLSFKNVFRSREYSTNSGR